MDIKAQTATNPQDGAGFINVLITDDAIRSAETAIRAERNPYHLGLILDLDLNLDLPRRLVAAVYERLFELGITDALTRRCYAEYLKLMWGPDRESEADKILLEVQPALDAAGFDRHSGFGHHPTFYAFRRSPIAPTDQ